MKHQKVLELAMRVLAIYSLALEAPGLVASASTLAQMWGTSSGMFRAILFTIAFGIVIPAGLWFLAPVLGRVGSNDDSNVELLSSSVSVRDLSCVIVSCIGISILAGAITTNFAQIISILFSPPLSESADLSIRIQYDAGIRQAFLGFFVRLVVGAVLLFKAGWLADRISSNARAS